MAGPLSHIRVLDLSRVLAAPWTGQNLADLGAEVIKVERPKTGDDSRAFGPPWLKDAAGRDTTESAYFACANRGKKSVTLNLAKPAGQEIVRKLAATSDVLVENYKVGDLPRYGLGYEDLRKINPRLVYCSVTGFGQTGPYAERPGYDFMIQGMAGLMSITGERDDLPGGGPQKAGIPIGDIITGMYATIAVCAALASRERTGAGQHLDLALLDSLTAILANQGGNYLATGVSPGRLGNAHPNIVPYQTFRTADGDIVLACGNDNLFRKFCEVAGCQPLAADPRFATNNKRVENREEITRLLNEIIAKRTTRDWVAALEAAGVPNGPINTLEQVFQEPQAIARGLKIELDHALAGKVSLVRSPMRFSATPIEHSVPPPTLGQHTDEVLRGLLQLSEADIAKLRAEGVMETGMATGHSGPGSGRPGAERPSPASGFVLIACNLVPLAGLLFWGWRLGDVVMLYWLENVVVGVMNVLRIMRAVPEDLGFFKQLGVQLSARWLFAGKVFLAAFFIVHYGGFCLGHGIFLTLIFPVGERGPDPFDTLFDTLAEALREPGMLVALIALVVSHAYSYFRNYIGTGEYLNVDVGALMIRPYGRIFVVQVFIIAGGMLVVAGKASVAAIILFVALKIGVDFLMHRRERALLASAAPSNVQKGA